MEKAASAKEHGPEDHPPASPEMEVASDAITRPILKAIGASKAAVKVCIDHLATECTLIRHDLDKICGRLTAEDRISQVEDASHAQGSQLTELQEMVRSLQRRADDAENRPRRNNVLVVGLPEAEGAKTTMFA